jgi:hypothetical protein
MNLFRRLSAFASVLLAPALAYAQHNTIKPLSDAAQLGSKVVSGMEILIFLYIGYRISLAGMAYADGDLHARERFKSALMGAGIAASSGAILEVIRQTFLHRMGG